MTVLRHWRLYECADCEDHQEVRYDGMPTMCVHCGGVHSFVDAGPIDVAQGAVEESERLQSALDVMTADRDSWKALAAALSGGSRRV